jgi:predicted dehydrogenase
MPEKKYRVAVVGGAGTWGRYYLRAFAEHPDCEIVALVDRARDRRQAFATRYGIEAVYDTVDELLARDVPDIVSAILPVAYTYDAVIACAEAGVKVVSCEKPIAAELARADTMVRICRERGTALGCGTGHWNAPYLQETVEWIRAGNIGPLTAAAIPRGLVNEVAGGGCAELTQMRFLTGMEVEWVEGWTLPPLPGYRAQEATLDTQVDRPAWGRLGLSGGIVCEICEPPSEPKAVCSGVATGDNGQVWLSRPRPVLVQGKGAESTPVFPDFFDAPQPETFFVPVIEQLMSAFDSGEECECSGRDYLQALEIAIALVQSAHCNHQRIKLPLEDRSLKIYPHPYRLYGGDEAGWESIGYAGPPAVA